MHTAISGINAVFIRRTVDEFSNTISDWVDFSNIVYGAKLPALMIDINIILYFIVMKHFANFLA